MARFAGVGSAVPLWDSASDSDVLYVYGERDSRCCEAAAALRAELCETKICAVPGRGPFARALTPLKTRACA